MGQPYYFTANHLRSYPISYPAVYSAMRLITHHIGGNNSLFTPEEKIEEHIGGISLVFAPHKDVHKRIRTHLSVKQLQREIVHIQALGESPFLHNFARRFHEPRGSCP